MADDLLAKARQKKLLQQAQAKKSAQGGGPLQLDVRINPTGQAGPGDSATGVEQPSVWEDMAARARLATSKFNAGLGGMASGLLDLPRNAMQAVGWNEPFTGGIAQSVSDLGHSIGDPIQKLQTSPEDQAATESRLNLLEKAAYIDLPHMAPAVLGGPLAPELIAGQAVSQSLDPAARAQAEAQAKAEGREPPTGLETWANAGLQGAVALTAGKLGPLGRIGGEALPAARQAGLEAFKRMSGTVAKDYAVTAGATEAGQQISHGLMGTPVNPEAATRAGLAGAMLGVGVEAVKPEVQPNTTPGKVEVVVDPVGIERGKAAETAEVAKLPFVEAPDPRAAEIKAQAVESMEPVALKEILPSPDDAQQIGEWHDAWIADRDEAQVNARLTASTHEAELKAAVPGEAFSELLKRVAATGERQSPAYRDMNEAMLVYIDTRGKAAEEFDAYGTSLSPEQRRIFQLSQNLPPEVKAIADSIAKENDAQGAVAKEAGVINEARENYVARLWKPIEEGSTAPPPEATAKFTTTSGRLRGRTYGSVLEGWAQGRELNVAGAIDAQRVAAEQVHQVIADRKLLELGLQAKMFTREPGPDSVQIEHPNFRASQWVRNVEDGQEAGPLGPGLYEQDGKIFQKRPVYADKEVGDRLNRALGTSQLSKIRGVKTATTVNNIAKQSMLLYSFFHHIAMTTAYTLGSPTSLKNLNIKGAYRAGREQLKYPSATLNELVRAGMTVGRAQDYEAFALADKGTLEARIDSWPVAAQVKNVLKAIRDQQHDVLFHRFMPALKTQAANLEFNKQLQRNKQALLDGTITRDEIARGVAVTMNNRFQSQNLMRLDRSPTTQHVFRLAALAPDWTESQMRFAAQGFKPGFEGKLARETWARILFKGALATQTANLIMASFDDRSYWDRIKDAYNSKDTAIGGGLRALYNVDVTPLYKGLGGSDESHKFLSIINQYDFPFHLLEKGPVDVAKSKASPLARAIWDAGAGTDWAGKPITTLSELLGIDNKGIYATGKRGEHLPGDEKGGKLAGQTASYQSESESGPISPNQYPSWAIQEGMGILPLEMQNTIGWLTGQQDGWDAALKSLGFRATSSDPESVLKRMLEDEAQHAENLGQKRAAEARLKAFNKQAQIRKLGGH